MFSGKHITIGAYFLVIFCVNNVKSVSKSTKENKKAVQTEEKYIEVKKNLGKLNEVLLKDVTVNGESDEEGCICVPFYLCDNGEIVKDGRFLLSSRVNINPCSDQDVCCERGDINIHEVPDDTTISWKIPPAPNSTYSKCGYGNVTQQEFSDDPTLSKYGEFPWTVTIFQKLSSGPEEYRCVGSLINPEVVLTAAHCINKLKDVDIIVRAGKWNISSKNESSQGAYVGKIIKHPKFGPDNLFYDVALLTVDPPFDLDEHINTVCLTDSVPDSQITRFDECLTSGWGIDDPSKPFSTTMKKIECSLVHHEKCQQILRTTRVGKWFQLHKSFICALGQNGSDVCEGYGGAPLVCSIGNQPKRYQQVGITSWGIGCAHQDRPSVFTKISEIKDWIDEQFDTLNISKDYYTYQYS